MTVADAILRPLFDWRGAIISPFGPPSATCRLVLLTMSCYMNVAGDSCYPTLDELAAATQLSKRAVQNNIDEAQKSGWLGKQANAKGEGKGWRRIEYFAVVPVGVEEQVTTWRAKRRASWLENNRVAPRATRNGDKKRGGKPVDKSPKSYPHVASGDVGVAPDDTKSKPHHIRFNSPSKGAKGAPAAKQVVDKSEKAPPTPTSKAVDKGQDQKRQPTPYWERSDEALMVKCAEENISTHGLSREALVRKLTEKLGAPT